MTQTEARRLRRERKAAMVAAGTWRPRSHYLTADIRDSVQEDLLAMRQQIAAQRKIRSRDWAFRKQPALPQILE